MVIYNCGSCPHRLAPSAAALSNGVDERMVHMAYGMALDGFDLRSTVLRDNADPVYKCAREWYGCVFRHVCGHLWTCVWASVIICTNTCIGICMDMEYCHAYRHVYR